MDLRNAYFTYIIDLIMGKKNGCKYSQLLSYLMNMDYTYSIGHDDNRMYDGLELRDRFAYEFDISDLDMKMLFGNTRCSILEMLIALTLRGVDNIIADGDNVEIETYENFFFDMINNLGLIDCYGKQFSPECIEQSIDAFLNQLYNKDGSNGALFTTRDKTKDFRKTEIWYQMCTYINENYFS